MVDAETMFELFNVIVFIYGVYCVYAAKKMTDTKTPPTFLVPSTELIGARDVAGFCMEIRKPLIIYGVISAASAVVCIAAKYLPYQGTIQFAAILIFLILCFWFVKLVRKYKTQYF